MVDDDDQDGGDIEAAIQKEVGDLKDKKASSSNSVFTEVRINQECLLFMKCKSPVEPVGFSRRICLDAASVGHGGAKARYLNRLTPVSVIVKASENGLEEGARRALAGHFKLKSKETGEEKEGEGDKKEEEAASPATVSFLLSL